MRLQNVDVDFWSCVVCNSIYTKFCIHCYGRTRGLFLFFFFFRHSCWCIVQYYLLVLMFNRCPVTVDMKIKLITRQTVQKYKAVRSYPCIITIEGEHNRNIECVLSVKQLRVLSATMQDFFQLFSIRKVETLIRE